MGKLYDDYIVNVRGQRERVTVVPSPVTRAEYAALLARVTELEKRYREGNGVTKLSNAAKQKAYRERKHGKA